MHTKNIHWVLAIAALSGLAFAGCGDDDGGVDSGPGTDSGPRPDGGPTPDGGPGSLCDQYCAAITTNCTAANAQYLDMAQCMTYCAGASWPDGTAGDMDGNTLSCRIYHGGAPAAGDPGMHCPHAGPSGGNVCGIITFGTEAGTRVDRMGLPAVSTALVTGDADKEAFNDADPAMDPTFAGELITNLTALHMVLDDDISDPPTGTPPDRGLGFTPCSMTETVGPLPECLGQEIATGVSVASIALPDTLKIDPAGPAGFPNGRRLEDPVIDVILSIILLEMGGACPTVGEPCTPVSLLGTNPPAHTDYTTTFPYLGPPTAP